MIICKYYIAPSTTVLYKIIRYGNVSDKIMLSFQNETILAFWGGGSKAICLCFVCILPFAQIGLDAVGLSGSQSQICPYFSTHLSRKAVRS